jgi:hypothetical protein
VGTRSGSRLPLHAKLRDYPYPVWVAPTTGAFAVADLPIPELVENQRRSIAMLPVGAPALNRDEALEVLQQLVDALREVRDLRRRVG